MKASFLFKSAMAIAVMGLVWGCQKEALKNLPLTSTSTEAVAVAKKTVTQTHKLKGEFMGTWRLVQLSTGALNVYGTAEGHVASLGKSTCFFNSTLAYPGATSYGNAPLSNIDSLENALNDLGYTDLKDLSVIVFDQQGNSIWSNLKSPGTYTYAAPTDPVQINGEYVIVSGTGKFANATGWFTVKGYWNPVPPHDTGLEFVDGEITY